MNKTTQFHIDNATTHRTTVSKALLNLTIIFFIIIIIVCNIIVICIIIIILCIIISLYLRLGKRNKVLWPKISTPNKTFNNTQFHC